MNKRKIYIIGNAFEYSNWMESERVNDLAEADLVLATGGEDWHPSFYYKGEHSAHPTVFSSLYRDKFEMPVMKQAVEMGKKLIGICRGAQGGCVLAGGVLVQHQNDPHSVHKVICHDGQNIYVTSSHHQAQYPFGLKEGEDYKLLNWTENYVGPKYLDSKTITDNPIDVETAFYPKINFLAIQSHPEWLFRSREVQAERMIAYFRDLLDKHMNGEL